MHFIHIGQTKHIWKKINLGEILEVRKNIEQGDDKGKKKESQ
jgi:hypothetical protein